MADNDATLALSVSSSFGYVCSLEYLNVLRGICRDPLLTSEDYDKGVAACNRLGRDEVIRLHRAAFIAFRDSPSADPLKHRTGADLVELDKPVLE